MSVQPASTGAVGLSGAPTYGPSATGPAPVADEGQANALLAGRADDAAAVSGPGSLRAMAAGSGALGASALGDPNAMMMMLAQQQQSAASLTSPTTGAPQQTYRSFATDAGIDGNGNAQGKGVTSAALIDPSDTTEDAAPTA